MRRTWLTVCLLALIATGTQAQDFASRYMAEHKGDSLLHCISVSPKMMEEILDHGIGENDTTGMADIISRLKSMQIVNAGRQGKTYFKHAEEMARKNSARFKELASYDEGKDHCRIFVREHKTEIVELVLLRQVGKQFTVINFTGDMNHAFIRQLTHTMVPAAATSRKE